MYTNLTHFLHTLKIYLQVPRLEKKRELHTRSQWGRKKNFSEPEKESTYRFCVSIEWRGLLFEQKNALTKIPKQELHYLFCSWGITHLTLARLRTQGCRTINKWEEVRVSQWNFPPVHLELWTWSRLFQRDVGGGSVDIITTVQCFTSNKQKTHKTTTKTEMYLRYLAAWSWWVRKAQSWRMQRGFF